MAPRWYAAVAAGTAALIGLSGCAANAGQPAGHGAAGPSPAGAASAAGPTTNPYAVGPIDPPAPNEPVLTVTGGRTGLALTLDQLDAMGDTTITIDEPFVKKRQTFSGTPLAVVLAKAGIPSSAAIDTVALNDYHYLSTAEPMIESQALIATKRDGAAIPYDQGGPTRLVFPDGSPLSTVLDAWNWSLASITVKGPGP